ncbi:hypothetical protein BGZ96_012404 [Linnemannia gamsii]|uniref:No apical meristem-associated C-terminal domain-containing protein n=1 Tax=Linnemannia gamsii TaxID=64522 RepID=A0ABQ7JQG7_9FUNG|nr:hypothetical protein BGZ96_012404 [Linnemannia gamsii]
MPRGRSTVPALAPAPAPTPVIASSSTRSTNRKRGPPTSLPSSDNAGSVKKMKKGKGKAVKVDEQEQEADDTKFWKKPGMTRFLKWLLDHENQNRLKEAGTTAGIMKKDLYKEVADLVNAEPANRADKTWKPWTLANVKYNIRSSESKYKKAKAMLNETGGGDDDRVQLLREVRKICPQYDDFHSVYMSNRRLNPPRMIQTTTIPGESIEFSDDSENDNGSSESEGHEGGEVGYMGVDGEESDGGDDDVRELEGHHHVRVEGFDMAQLLAGYDETETPPGASTSSGNSARHSSSSTKKQPLKNNAGKGKAKDTPHQIMFQRLTELSSKDGATSGLLDGMRKDLAEKERACLEREKACFQLEMNWARQSLERVAELDRRLEERRQEHEKQV